MDNIIIVKFSTSLTVVLLSIILSASITYQIEHSKSYLLDDHSSIFISFEADQNWLYIPSSNDVVQRSIETGQVVRTLRGHSFDVQDLFIVNVTTLFSGSTDGLIVEWDLVTGTITKRLDSKCSIARLVYYLGNILVSCYNANSRMISVENNQIIATLELGQYFYAYEDIFYGYFSDSGLEMYTRNLMKTTILTGSFSTVTRNQDIIFVADLNSFKVASLSVINGSFFQFSGVGHNSVVSIFCLIKETLMSGGLDGRLVFWDTLSGKEIMNLNYGLTFGSAYLIKPLNDFSILVSFQYICIVLLDIINSYEVIKTYRGNLILLKSLAIYEDLVFSGSASVMLKEWSISQKSLVQSFSNNSYSPALFVESGLLLLCYSSIVMMDIKANAVVKEFAVDQVRCQNSFTYNDGFIYAPTRDFAINKYNYSSDELVLQFHDSSITSEVESVLAFGEYLFVSYLLQKLVEWDVGTGRYLYDCPYQPLVGNLFFSYKDHVIGVGGSALYQVNPSNFMFNLLTTQPSVIYAFYYDEVSNMIFVSGDPPSIFAMDADNFNVEYQLDGHSDIVNKIIVQDKFLFSCSNDGTVKQFSLLTRRIVFSFEDRGQSVTSVVRFNNSVIFGTLGGILYDFKQDTGMFSEAFSEFRGAITDILVFDGLLFISSADQTISLLDSSSFSKTLVLNVSSIPNALEFSEGFLYSGNTDHRVIKWNSTSETIAKNYLGHDAIINDIMVDGTDLFTAGNDFIICRWSLDLSIITIKYKAHSDAVTSIVLFESKLFSASLDKAIIMWDIDNGSILKILKRTTLNPGHLGPINQIKICHGYLFSASSDLTIKQWDISTGLVVDTLFGHQKGVTCLYCDGVSLLSGSQDFSVFLWYPQFPTRQLTSVFSSLTSKGPTKVLLSQTVSNNSNFLTLSLIIATGFMLLLAILIRIFVFIRQKVYKEKDEKSTSFTSQNSNSYSSTMFTQSLGLALPGFLEIFSSSITLKKQIAKGGGGTIFMCEISNNTQLMVAKVFSDKFEYLNAKRKLSFDQEITIMDYLKSHRNIAKIVGYCRNQPCCIIMKFYEKGSLDHFLRSHSSGERSYSKAVMIRFLKDIVLALQFMHSKHLAHCDVKPQNILIDSDDNGLFLVLTDFGITVVLDQSIIAAQTFTVVNLKGMSVYYAGPEVFDRFKKAQYNDPQIMKAGDIYAFSVIVYEMLVKRIPWCYT